GPRRPAPARAWASRLPSRRASRRWSRRRRARRRRRRSWTAARRAAEHRRRASARGTWPTRRARRSRGRSRYVGSWTVLLVRRQLRARRHVAEPVRRHVARADGDGVAVPQVVERVHESLFEDVHAAVATAVELAERVGAVLLDGELRQTFGRVRPRPGGGQHAVELD